MASGCDHASIEKIPDSFSFGIGRGRWKIGFDAEVDDLVPILAPLMAYIVGQGVADAGKEKAKFESNDK